MLLMCSSEVTDERVTQELSAGYTQSEETSKKSYWLNTFAKRSQILLHGNS